MKLLNKIKGDYLVLRKAGSASKADKLTLATFLGDMETAAKNGIDVNDCFVEDALTKAIKTARGNLELTSDHKFWDEISVYENYLPAPLANDEILKIIVEKHSEGGKFNTIGGIMDYFKANFKGRYDGKVVSSSAKIILNNGSNNA